METKTGIYKEVLEGDDLKRARPSRDRRVRYGKYPVPAESATTNWGREVPEIASVTDVQLTRMLMDHPCFKETVGRKLDKIDSRNHTLNGKRMGRKPKWSAWELETVLVFGRMCGATDIKDALRFIRAEDREPALLGFPDRKHPSESTVSRYRLEHFNHGERAELYLELDRRLRDLVTDLPGFDDEARLLGMDGSTQGTRHQPPPGDNYEGPFKGKVTAPQAAYGGHHAGKGWQLIALLTERGTPLAWEITPLNEPEAPVGARVVKSYAKHIAPKRDPEKISICSCDAGFKGPDVHRELLEARIVPNIHNNSHSTRPRSVRGVREAGANWWPLHHPDPRKKHYMKWMINGLGELTCKCGNSTPEKITKVSPQTGKLTVGTRGRCENGCGTVSILSGSWRHAQHPKRATPILQTSKTKYHPDYTVGNPFTFNDPLAEKYGKGRFSWNESFHHAVSSRFKLLCDGSAMRFTTEPVAEFAVMFSAISILLLHRGKQIAGPTTTEPLPAPGHREVDRPEREMSWTLAPLPTSFSVTRDHANQAASFTTPKTRFSIST